MPRRKGGLWLPLDVNFMDDVRIVRAGEKAAWLYLSMALACKRIGSDGVLDVVQIERLHVTDWRKRIVPLLAEQLVLDYLDGTYALSAWLRHNDPMRSVEERREADAERKRSTRVRTESVRTSVPSPSVEKNREERSSEGSPDCTHGATGPADCALCRRALRAVS